jgi:hypothetical protein
MTIINWEHYYLGGNKIILLNVSIIFSIDDQVTSHVRINTSVRKVKPAR